MVEFGRLDAVKPPITLVGSKIRTHTELFQLVGEKLRISVNQFPAQKARRGEVNTFELKTAELEVLGSNPGRVQKKISSSFPYAILHGKVKPFFHLKTCIPEDIFIAYHDLVPALTIQTFFQLRLSTKIHNSKMKCPCESGCDKLYD